MADTSLPSENNTSKKRAAILEPLKFRDFTLLLIGQFVSAFGDAFYVVALPWLMFANGTPQDLGKVLVVYGIPRIAGVLLVV